MIFIAFTKKVVLNGKISVSQGQCVTIAITEAATDTKNNNHIKTLFLFSVAIFLFVYANLGEAGNKNRLSGKYFWHNSTLIKQIF